MKILVCGGRKYFDWLNVRATLDEFHTCGTPITCVIQGGAAGADRLGKHWASLNSIPCKEYPADWKFYGKDAGKYRNQQMLDENPDIEVAFVFPGGYGTWDMEQRVRRANIRIISGEEPPPF
jgi:hypothetical protein